MARRSNLTALAALGTLGYMLSKKGDKKDDKKTEMPAVENLPVARPSMRPREIERNLDDDLYSDYGPSAGRSSGETVSAPKKPVASGKPAVKTTPTKPASGTTSKVRDYQAEQDADNPRGSRSMVMFPGTADQRGTASETRVPRFTPNEPIVQSGRQEDEESVKAEPVDETKLSANERLKRSIERNLSGFRRGSGPTDYRPVNERFKRGGKVKKMASGGMTSSVSSASKRADGIATKGKTRGKMY